MQTFLWWHNYLRASRGSELGPGLLWYFFMVIHRQMLDSVYFFFTHLDIRRKRYINKSHGHCQQKISQAWATFKIFSTPCRSFSVDFFLTLKSGRSV